MNVTLNQICSLLGKVYTSWNSCCVLKLTKLILMFQECMICAFDVNPLEQNLKTTVIKDYTCKINKEVVGTEC